MTARGFLSAAAIALVCLGTSAEAATLNIRATVLNGLYQGESVTGTLEYDETMVFDEDPAKAGDEDGLTPGNGIIKLFFQIDELILTHMNDFDAPGFPRVTFIDGLLDDINYRVKHGVNGADLLRYGVRSFEFARLRPSGEDSLYDVGVDVTYGTAVIPLPAGLPLLGGGLALLALLRRKRRH